MKKSIILVTFMLSNFVNSQTNYLAFSSNNGVNNKGSIMNFSNGTPQNKINFYDNGGPPMDNIVEIGVKLYGITGGQNSANNRTLYEYHYNNEVFNILKYFGDTSSSNPLITKLCTNGTKIFGIQNNFFTGQSISEYNVSTNTVTQLISLSSYGINDVKQILCANNKIYGITTPTATVGANKLFSFDLSTNTLSIVHVFATATGNWCHSIMKHSNGKIYGATVFGGTNGQGTIFELNPTNDSYSVLTNLTASLKADNLTEGASNKLYGINRYNIYQFDLNTNSLSNVYNFSSTIQPEGNSALDRDFNPLIYKDGKLYGFSEITSSSDQQVFFNYDITNNVIGISINNPYEKILSIYKSTSNKIILSKEITNNGNGNLFEFNAITQNLTPLQNTDFGTNGIKPRKMIKSSTGLIYGVTASDPARTYGDRFFSYNPITNEYNILIEFSPTIAYGNDPINLIETSSGKIYIYSSIGSNSSYSQQGKLIEYNPTDGSHSLAHSFSSLFDSQTLAEDLKLFEKNNIIYGVKKWGGNNVLHKGTIFSYNTLTHIYSVLYESDFLENNVASLLSSQDIIYGVTTTGGSNNQGFLYSFNLTTNQFNIIESLNTSGLSSLVETVNGDIYGVFENSHGTDGSIFKISNSGVFSIYYQFNHSSLNTGKNPSYIYYSNSNLYVESETFQVPTENNYYSVFLTKYNLSNSSVNLLFNGLGTNSNGMDSYILSNKISIMNNGIILIPTEIIIGTSFIPKSLLSYNENSSSMNVYLNFGSNFYKAYNLIDVSDLYLSTVDYNHEHNLKLYPNPTKGTIFFEHSGNDEIKDIKIHDVYGRFIKSENIVRDNKVDISELPSGIYIFTFETKFGKKINNKIIKN